MPTTPASRPPNPPRAPDAAVRVVPGERRPPPRAPPAVPPLQRRDRPIEQASPAPGPAARDSRAPRAPGAARVFVAPLAVGVQPLDAVDGARPVASSAAPASASRGARRPQAAEPRDVLDDRRGSPPSGYGARRHVERDVVPAVRADLDGVEAQHAVEVGGRIGRARAVAVVGEDDELQAGARRGRGEPRRSPTPSERVVWT